MKIFTKHPHSVGESYFQHLLFATSFGAKMIYGGLCCIIHGFLPFLCETTGSRTTLKLSEKITNRTKN